MQEAPSKRRQAAKGFRASVCHSCEELAALWKKGAAGLGETAVFLLKALDLAFAGLVKAVTPGGAPITVN